MSIQFHDAGDVKTALLLTMLGACGTALGGLIVVAQPDMSLSRLGLLQACIDAGRVRLQLTSHVS